MVHHITFVVLIVESLIGSGSEMVTAVYQQPCVLMCHLWCSLYHMAGNLSKDSARLSGRAAAREGDSPSPVNVT